LAIFLNLLRNPYAIGVLAVLLVGGIQQARVWKAQAEAAQAVSELVQQREAWQRAVAEGQEAARKAVEAARAAERAAADERLAQQQAASERLREAARIAQTEANEWRARYRQAQREDASCAAWVREKVQCPVE
jgi:cytoskeletal protein RodZ